MVELTGFAYRSGASVVHGLDARFKLLFLALMSLSSLHANLVSLSALSIFLVLLIFHVRQPIRAVFVEIRYFMVLLAFVFIFRAMAAPGAPFLELKIISVSREGLYDATVVCWRLLAIVMLSHLMVATTRTSQIKAAVQWLLKPFPLIPEKRVATMMGLIVRFVPVILGQAKETEYAQKARGVENRRNPVYRIRKLLFPIVRRTFESADRLAVAMEARCYSENRTDPPLALKKSDWVALLVVLCLCLLVVSI